MKTPIAAILVAAAMLGGASAAIAGGSYYEGVSSTPLFTGRAEASAGAGASASSASRGDYYAGIDDRSVDATATGAITNGHAKAFGTTDENDQ
ncbi:MULTISPECIES: hypothetical protein [unclassified Ensifer]|uniref:hypothetical protein n=1 Tax=unclassified Ensifer TaxID=2633371 RepID=UPI0008130A93|nr:MULTISPECIES: hypothetical protein [unclassified Ensifer]OCP01388.1 hypothetical protein BC362_23485 [Ensifer sp. LC14]OCP03279.1 hypothetical protein BBX50_06610 [Ensifer sp. LC11]OCP03650.1 hypothetical protein BC374_06665 [Ensifer sp. LC13]OCP34063.1 hypothetical protein BC364_14155 [Ensifer sp. LC499]